MVGTVFGTDLVRIWYGFGTKRGCPYHVKYTVYQHMVWKLVRFWYGFGTVCWIYMLIRLHEKQRKSLQTKLVRFWFIQEMFIKHEIWNMLKTIGNTIQSKNMKQFHLILFSYIFYDFNSKCFVSTRFCGSLPICWSSMKVEQFSKLCKIPFKSKARKKMQCFSYFRCFFFFSVLRKIILKRFEQQNGKMLHFVFKQKSNGGKDSPFKKWMVALKAKSF